MNNQKIDPKVLRNTVDDLFTTVDDFLKNDQLSKDDQEWLEKELEEMEQKLKTYKKKKESEVKVG